MAVSEALDIIKDVALSCAAIVTASVATLGLNSWRRELGGKARFETAKSLIRATYRVRDEIQSSRSRLISSSEYPLGYNSLDSQSPQREAEAWTHIYNNRWQPVRGALLAFDSTVLEAEALWGHEVQERADELRQCARDLRVAMEATIDDKAESGETFASDKDWAQKMRSTVHASRDEMDNSLTKRIENAIAAIEAITKPHLSRT